MRQQPMPPENRVRLAEGLWEKIVSSGHQFPREFMVRHYAKARESMRSHSADMALNQMVQFIIARGIMEREEYNELVKECAAKQDSDSRSEKPVQ